MKNKPMRTKILFYSEEILYVLFYQGKQIYTEKRKTATAGSKAKFERNKSVYFTKQSAQEGIINYIKVYGLNEKDFTIETFKRER